jgi:DNA-binding FadR family transcriptional regulator
MLTVYRLGVHQQLPPSERARNFCKTLWDCQFYHIGGAGISGANFISFNWCLCLLNFGKFKFKKWFAKDFFDCYGITTSQNKEKWNTMLSGLDPVKTDSLKAICIKRFEGLILSGAFAAGEKLPPERELAKRLGVSRPVVHEALVDIAAKGLVTITPRKGAMVNDFRRQGSVSLLISLLEYHDGKLDSKLLDGLLNMRLLVEIENARLAARNRTEDQLAEFNNVLCQEAAADHADIEVIIQLDFEFHLILSIATDNLLYPLLLNSFKPVYTNFSGQFFKESTVVDVVFDFHRKFVAAIADQDEQRAADVMHQMLSHGEDRLRKIISK